MEEKTNNTIINNYGCCCNGGNNNNSTVYRGVPVGAIIVYMGIKAPEHYLICDGCEYEIESYPNLVQQIAQEFGKVNYYGGDGEITFAVPDLRNEFLRGYHGNTAEKLSEEIGQHQEATKHVSISKYPDSLYGSVLQSAGDENIRNIQTNEDKVFTSTYRTDYTPTKKGEAEIDLPALYTSRPTNVAVLFCIKY